MAPQQSACLRCHKHKVGCSTPAKGKPCRRCTIAGVECKPQPAKASKDSTMEAMRDQIATLQNQLNEAYSSKQSTPAFSPHPGGTNPAWTLGSPNSLPPHPSSREICSPLETYQLLSDPEAENLLGFFFQHMGRCFPMLCPTSAPSLRQDSPALLFALCAVAGRHAATTSPGLPDALWNKALRLLQSAIFSFSPSDRQGPLEVQALCLCAMYPPSSPPDDADGFARSRVTFSYMLTGHAIRLAHALNLFQPPPPQGLSDPSIILAVRTALGLYVLDHSFALSMGRPPALLLSQQLCDIRDALANSSTLLPSDVYLVAMFDLLSLHNKATMTLDQLGHDPVTAARFFHQFELDIHNWSTATATHRPHVLTETLYNILELHKNHTLVAIFSRSLTFYLKGFLSPSPADFAPFVSKTIRAASASGKMILAVAELRPLNLHLSYAPGVYLIAYPALLLLQLSTIELFHPFLIGLDVVSDCLRLRDVLVQSIRQPGDTISTVTAYITAALSQQNASSNFQSEQLSMANPAVLLARTEALQDAAKVALELQSRMQQHPTVSNYGTPPYNFQQASEILDGVPLFMNETWLWTDLTGAAGHEQFFQGMP